MIRYRPADSLIPVQAALESVGLHGCQMIIGNEKRDLSRAVTVGGCECLSWRATTVSAGSKLARRKRIFTLKFELKSVKRLLQAGERG